MAWSRMRRVLDAATLIYSHIQLSRMRRFRVASLGALSAW